MKGRNRIKGDNFDEFGNLGKLMIFEAEHMSGWLPGCMVMPKEIFGYFLCIFG